MDRVFYHYQACWEASRRRTKRLAKWSALHQVQKPHVSCIRQRQLLTLMGAFSRRGRAEDWMNLLRLRQLAALVCTGLLQMKVVGWELSLASFLSSSSKWNMRRWSQIYPVPYSANISSYLGQRYIRQICWDLMEMNHSDFFFKKYLVVCIFNLIIYSVKIFPIAYNVVILRNPNSMFLLVHFSLFFVLNTCNQTTFLRENNLQFGSNCSFCQQRRSTVCRELHFEMTFAVSACVIPTQPTALNWKWWLSGGRK